MLIINSNQANCLVVMTLDCRTTCSFGHRFDQLSGVYFGVVSFSFWLDFFILVSRVEMKTFDGELSEWFLGTFLM